MTTALQSQTLDHQLTKHIRCRYLLHLPTGYGRSKRRWPLVLFLHGAGERGNDLALVQKHGPAKLVAAGKHFPFILVAPQCPANQWWDNETLLTLLDHIRRRYRVDADRVYLTGLSMGGFGTWMLALHAPERFAAIAPICGGGMAFLAYRLKNIPTWVFHGAKDTVVPLEQSQEMVDALTEGGGKVKFTVYPEAGHDSWTESYANPELYRWLLKQRRKL